MHGRDMKETSIINNLNYKVQAHARMCQENKLELEQKTTIEIILW